MSENIQRLRELAKLLDSGHINRAEFERAKQTIFSEEQAAPTLPASDDTPRRIGPYQVKEVLGEGGMGQVFRARHMDPEIAEEQGGDIALKLLHDQHTRNPIVRERFQQEARLGMRLKHPGIGRTLELWVEKNQIGLVMEYITGTTLGHRIRSSSRCWTWAEARPLLSQLMDAVAYAHAEGVIHRDLKPDNVIIQPDGTLKVLDFGIAKSQDAQLTQTGLGLGTADYMSPEQYLSAKSVDGRADIYSLGIILYQMLAGRLPWEPTPSVEAILHLKKRGGLPPPCQHNEAIPSELSSMIMRMLAAEKEDRFSTISTLRATVAAVDHMVGQTILIEPDYDPAPTSEGPQPRPQSRSSGMLYLAIIGLAVLFVGIGFAGTFLYFQVESGSRPERSDPSSDDDEDAKKEEPTDPRLITSRDQLTTKVRRQFQIQIRTDQPQRVQPLAQELRGLGYKVRVQASSVFNRQVRWEAAPEPVIDEIMEHAVDSVAAEAHEFSLLGPRDGDDTKVLLDIPFDGYR